jgi:pimeloyl-ACP methyl ester carboxylesterase
MPGSSAPDRRREPDGFMVAADSGDRIHFLDWGEPPTEPAGPPIVLVPGLASTAWVWLPVARRLAQDRRVVAMDLRGHGRSDAPTEGYDLATLGRDVEAVVDAVAPGREPVVLAGHGFGAIVAASAAALLGDRVARLVLVDGGWEDVAGSIGMDPDEFLRTIEEPPEVLRSMASFLADRAAFDPATWDADQERAARATVVETAAGRLLASTRPHALTASVEAMFTYRPAEVLSAVRAPIVGLIATSPPPAGDVPPFELVRVEAIGHNLMRYRPDDVVRAIDAR